MDYNKLSTEVSNSYKILNPDYDSVFEEAIKQSESDVETIKKFMTFKRQVTDTKLNSNSNSYGTESHGFVIDDSAIKKVSYPYRNYTPYYWLFNGKHEIGPQNPKYWKLLNVLDSFMKQFAPADGTNILGAEDMLQITPYLTNYPGLVSYPIQVHLQNSNTNDLPWARIKIEFLDILCDLFTAEYEFGGISLPKNSSVGFPTMINDDDKKVVVFERNLTRIREIADLTSDIVNNGSKASYNKLVSVFEISNVAVQGLRIQNDKHGEKGKDRFFSVRDHKFKTKVNFDDTVLAKEIKFVKGRFGRRNRVVYGMPYGLNAVTNAIVVPFRNYFYKEYEKTYKVRDSYQLDREFAKCVDMYGFDVTQLDRNTDQSHVTLINSYFTRYLKPEYKQCFLYLFRLMETPCMLNRHTDFHNELTVTGKFYDVGVDRVNHGVGIASGCSTTSECGKLEVSAFVCANLYNACLILESVLKNPKKYSAVINGYSNYLQKFNVAASDFSRQVNVLSKYDCYNKKKFCKLFIKSHFNDNVVFKNMGDDTIIGVSPDYCLLGFLNIVATCMVNEYRGVRFESTRGKFIENEYDKFKHLLETFKDNVCPWHIVDLEEPISYLGNVPHYIDGKITFLPSTRSYILNFFMGERTAYKGGVKPITWGIGLKARNEVYFKNPNCRKIWRYMNSAYRKIFNSSYDIERIINDHASMMEKEFMQLADRSNINVINEVDSEILYNPDVLHYKYAPEEASDYIRNIYMIYKSYEEGTTLYNFYNEIWSG